MNIEQLDFEKNGGLLPAILQDVRTRKVLMLGYMNREALERTRTEGVVTLFSRSRDRLWTKGETSGNLLRLVDIEADCDQDTLLVYVDPTGPVCHLGTDTCWGDVNQRDDSLCQLELVIRARRKQMPDGSYTADLFKHGIPKIAQKVGEEAVELIIAAIDGNDEGFLNEAADLVFHLLVLLEVKGHQLEDVARVLEQRHK